MLSKSRFNPAPGLADFWAVLRRPQPYRWTFLTLSVLPVMAIRLPASSSAITVDSSSTILYQLVER